MDGTVRRITRALLAKASTEFERAATRAVAKLARNHPTFSVEDVWAALPKNVDATDRRAMGGIMIRAREAGLISPSDSVEYTPAKRDSSTKTRSARRLWRSNYI